MPTEAAARADFTGLRYAQCWEDADVLAAGLATRPGETVLSIASAGDNSYALLLDDPARVVAVDLSPAQAAAVEVRRAMYRTLAHDEFLALYGSRPSRARAALYARCRPAMPAEARAWWDANPRLVAGGIGGAGKFERYFRLFRDVALPLVHRRRTVLGLLEPREPEARARWFDQVGPFEKMLADDGIHLVKYWINVGRATQLERFLDREKDPLKQWKLSQVDIDGLPKWKEYTEAIRETLTRTNKPMPWTVLRGDDKKRTRINAIRALLHPLDYTGKRVKAIGALDPRIIGGPEIVTRAGKDH